MVLCDLCGEPAMELTRFGYDILHTYNGLSIYQTSINICLSCGWSNPDDVCPCCREKMLSVAEHESRLNSALKEG